MNTLLNKSTSRENGHPSLKAEPGVATNTPAASGIQMTTAASFTLVLFLSLKHLKNMKAHSRGLQIEYLNLLKEKQNIDVR